MRWAEISGFGHDWCDVPLNRMMRPATITDLANAAFHWFATVFSILVKNPHYIIFGSEGYLDVHIRHALFVSGYSSCIRKPLP